MRHNGVYFQNNLRDEGTAAMNSRWTPVWKEWYSIMHAKCMHEIGCSQYGRREEARDTATIECIVRPSLLDIGLSYFAEGSTEGPAKSTVTIYMPIAVWTEWSTGAVTFAYVMCEDIVKDLGKTTTGVRSYSFHSDKAADLPLGTFGITLQFEPQVETK